MLLLLYTDATLKPSRRCHQLTILIENADQFVALFELADRKHVLFDVPVGATHVADSDEDVVTQELPGQLLDLTWERGAEHQRLVVFWHAVLLRQFHHRVLEAKVKHPVGLIQDEVFDLCQADLNHITQQRPKIAI